MNRIITVGREFGSGGRELGRRLAEELGIEYYDKEILSEITERTSLSEEYVSEVAEKRPHSLYPIIIGQSFTLFNQYYTAQLQSVYQAQCDAVKELAQKSDCVIIGRCADYILRDLNPFRIFVYADMESRVKRCMARQTEKENFTEKVMMKHIKKIDRDRADFYGYYTDRKWGDRINYDLCINTTNVEIKQIVPIIAKIFR